MIPCTPNPTGMCESCNSDWKEPASGCGHKECCGPYALGKTYNKYRDSLIISEISKCTIYAASEFSKNISSTHYP